MLSAIATLKVQPDKIDQAKAFFAAMVANVEANEPGTAIYIPHQRRGEPATFVFYEQYEDDEAFALHGANVRKTFKDLEVLLAGPPEIIFLDSMSLSNKG